MIKKLFKKYTNIWKKTSDLVGKELHNNMYYEDKVNDIKYIHYKISIINDEIKTNFYNNFCNNVEPKQNVASESFY